MRAALVNRAMVQGYEIDDANQAGFHACAVVLQTAFAAAEYIGADEVDGKKLLSAINAGFEVGPLVGHCLNGDRMIVGAWRAPGIFVPFPVALTARIILGLDADQLFHAVGIAGAQVAGLMTSQFGFVFKRRQCAKNAQSRLYAALLAAKGFTGIADVFELEYGGFWTTFTRTKDEFDLTQRTAGLGEQWETLRIDLKRHASRVKAVRDPARKQQPLSGPSRRPRGGPPASTRSAPRSIIRALRHAARCGYARAIRWTQRPFFLTLSPTTTTSRLASRVISELTPGSQLTTSEQLIDYIEREGRCAFHPAGSCKLGIDSMAVVDPRRRVIGVERARVADASIMPTVTMGNTNAPSTMIGEKSADLIHSDAR